MELTKEFLIREVRGRRNSSAPFYVIFEPTRLGADQESTLTLNEEACARHGFLMSLDLVGRRLLCTLQSRDLPLYDTGSQQGLVDRQGMGEDDVLINFLEKREYTFFDTRPVRHPSKHESVVRVLELSTMHGGGTLSVLPTPFYHLFIEVTEEMYEGCKKLSERSVFHISFQLKSESEE
jgi:hypothetical protein